MPPPSTLHVLQPELVPPRLGYEEEQEQQTQLHDDSTPIEGASLPRWASASSPISQQGRMPRMKLVVNNRVAYDIPMPSSLSAREACYFFKLQSSCTWQVLAAGAQVGVGLSCRAVKGW